MSEAVVQVRGLVNRFGSQLVHDGVKLTLHRGERLGVVGGSGSGKSVLMRCILGLQRPTKGEITVLGHRIGALGAEEQLELVRQIGVVYQAGALFSNLTVEENVALPLREHTDWRNPDRRELVMLQLQEVGLAPEDAHKYPSQLSGGMIKRTALARALILDPPLLFLDEPTAGLDPIAGAAFDELLNRMHEEHELTLMMITHDLDSLYSVCDRVAVLVDQKLLKGTLEEAASFEHPWVQEYFHGPRGRAIAYGRAGEAA